MLVLKFGGSSVKNAERIAAVKDIVLNIDQPKIVVFSALGNTTDTLIAAGQNALQGNINLEYLKELHHSAARGLNIQTDSIDPLFQELEHLLQGISLLKELSAKTHDYLVSFGERLAVRLISSYFNQAGIKSKFCDAFDLGLLSNSNFGDAEVNQDSLSKVKTSLIDLIKEGFMPIVTGFIAKDSNGNITTLGRGGSDLTASFIAAAIEADEVQVWKDVNGILTTDPRIVANARSIESIAFEEASELAYFGAKVLHPLSILPAMKADIPVRVMNSYNPSHPGTKITRTTENKALVRAITCKRNITLIDIVSSRMLDQHGFLANVFDIFKEAEISIDMLASSEVSISLTLNRKDPVDKIIKKLEEFSSVQVERGRAILSIIGDIERSSEILDRAFTVLNQNQTQVQMISQGASKVNIGFVLHDHEVENVLKNLHAHFFDQ
jgi:aspartate kinase